MGTADWFSGLMGGLAQGAGKAMLLKQEQELQQKKDDLSVVKSLITNEQWDVIPLLDPKTKKNAGVTPEFEQGIKPLADMKRQAKEAAIQQQKDQAEASKIALDEAKRKQAAFANLKPGQQQEADFPGVGKAEDRDLDRELKQKQIQGTEEERVRRAKLDQIEFDLKKQGLEISKQSQLWAHEDRMANNQSRIMQFEEMSQQRKVNAQNLEDNRAAKLDLAQERIAKKDFESAKRSYEFASKRIDTIKNTGPRDPKTKGVDLLYKTEPEAKAMADRLNKAHEELQKWDTKLAELSGMSPNESSIYTVIPETGSGLFGSTKFRVVSVTKSSFEESQKSAADTPKQGKFEHLLVPSGTQGQAQTPPTVPSKPPGGWDR